MQITQRLSKPLLFSIGAWVILLMSRLFQLGVIPAFITHDEIYYAAESQSVAASGSDLTGTWHPWSFTAASSLYAELPGTMISFGRIFGSNQLAAARVTSAVVGSLLPFILAMIAVELLKDKRAFWPVIAVAAFNPWLYQFSRMSFDAILSLFFYSLAMLALLKLKHYQKLWACLFIFLGFFQYQGLKIIMVPLFFTVLVYLWWQAGRPQPFKMKMDLRLVLAGVGIFCIALFGVFVVRLTGQSSSTRVNDLIFFKDDLLRRRVDEERRMTLTSPLMVLTSNKPTILANALITQYMKAFDLGQLFIYGESYRNPFSVWTTGMFYVIDLPLVILGIGWLWADKKRRPVAILLVSWLLLAPLPVAVNSIDAWLMFRAAWLIPTLLLLSASGVMAIWQYPLQLGKVALVSIYSLSVLWFGYQYWFRYPIFSTADKGFSERIMASYVTRLSDEKKVKILANESWFVFQSYLYYRNLITPENLPQIHQAFLNKKYILNNVEVDTRCFDANNLKPEEIIITEAGNSPCENIKPSGSVKQSAIASLIDSGSIYRVYNDQLCTQFNLRSFTKVNERRLLNIDALSNEEFCEAYFTYDK